MKYAQGNNHLFEFNYLEDKGNQVFLGLNKDTLTNSVVDKRLFGDMINRIRRAAPGRDVTSETISFGSLVTRMAIVQRRFFH
jgi:hypothetical protein